MTFSIRTAQKEDMPQVLELIQELAIYEKEPNAVEITVSDLEHYGFGSQPAFHCFVAEMNQNIAGIALVYTRFSTWKGKALHLEDLIVRESFRGHGLGKALLDEVVTYGKKIKAKRICWEVLDWNEPAITFYEKNGANVMRDWDVVQLDEVGMENYLSKL
ncbi:GNAT family N-acetyltransferase [Mangrovimonas cancribranchiae]|uniref:GNAT family N-acetyltransferase n=1 Tax=Mangrovimonas cancribranchiae TaxID=3080055 RepID=A0AAU6NXS3_9FLAO